MKHLLFILTILTLIACSDDETVQSRTFSDCSEVLENYQEYNNEEIGCQFHYRLAEYNNEQYIELRAHCADLPRAFVINQFCIDICETAPHDPNSECSKYLAGREVLEILYIEK